MGIKSNLTPNEMKMCNAITSNRHGHSHLADILQKTYTAHHGRMLVLSIPLKQEITQNQQESTDVSRGRDIRTPE
jgi:hypothetical protein